jgi:hypothetical protein
VGIAKDGTVTQKQASVCSLNVSANTMSQKTETMSEFYKEPDDKIGKHKVCKKCGLCMTCNDCKCNKSKIRCLRCGYPNFKFITTHHNALIGYLQCVRCGTKRNIHKSRGIRKNE